MSRFFVALAFTLTLCAAAVSADPFDTLDADHNGAISEDEAQAAGRALFKRLDQDGDGKLTPAEIGTRLGAPVFKAADHDLNGTLDNDEYAALVTARFGSANTDSDRTIGRDEYTSLSGALLGMMISDRVSAPQGIAQ
jgi:hypothetical protein